MRRSPPPSPPLARLSWVRPKRGGIDDLDDGLDDDDWDLVAGSGSSAFALVVGSSENVPADAFAHAVGSSARVP